MASNDILMQICKCFPFGEAEEEPSLRNNRTRVKIDRTMIGNPTDFRHTVHGTGGGNLQNLSEQMGSKGGEGVRRSSLPVSPLLINAIDLEDANRRQ